MNNWFTLWFLAIAIIGLLGLRGIVAILKRQQELTKMARDAFAEVMEAVERAASVNAAAIVVINRMADQINDMASQGNVSPAELRELAQRIKSHAQELADAIAEHGEEEEPEEEKEAE